MQLYRARSYFSKCQPFEGTSIAAGHAFQNGSHLKLNASLLCLVMLLKCQPFECSSIVPGHAFQNGSSLNAPPLCLVMLFKMAAI
jgi:hypothetical protein